MGFKRKVAETASVSGIFWLLTLIAAATPSAKAGIVGSEHDFSGRSFAPNGVCSACHIAHGGDTSFILWGRDLSEERAFFENVLNLPAGQKYTWGFTLGCYDCHDNHSTVDNDPDGFITNPHDIAFDADPKGIAYGTWDGTTGQVPTAEIGFFEDKYSGGSVDALGGHTFIIDPDGNSAGSIKPNDKIPCGDCHDPHNDQNESFIRGILGSGLKASRNTRNGSPLENGREICAACHAYSDAYANPGTPIDWATINPRYTTTDNGGKIRRPPATPTAHAEADATPCTDCHTHQQITPSCTGCHGNSANNTYWPDNPVTNLSFSPDRQGRHPKHIEALTDRLNATLPASGGWSDAPRTLLTMSGADQMRLCEYCHDDPSGVGGNGHNPPATAPADVGDFNPIWDTTSPAPVTADPGSSLTATTYTGDVYTGGGTCNSIDCHNNKTTLAATFGWYDAGTSFCTMCHTVGGGNSATEANPVSGLHNLAAVGTTAHDDNFGTGYDCTNCHVEANIAGHRDGAAGGNPPDYTSVQVGVSTLGGAGTYTDAGGTGATRGTCDSSCHVDGGDWQRKWSTDADTDHVAPFDPAQTYCTVCHGVLGAFNAGVEHVVNPPHGCDDCHFIQTNPLHWNNQIDLNDNLDAACSTTTSPVWDDDGPGGNEPDGVRCSGCHTVLADAHTSPREDGNYWPFPPNLRSEAGVCVSGGHPVSTCLDCHDKAQGPRRLITDANFTTGDFSLAVHHIDNSLAGNKAGIEAACRVCHYEFEDGSNDQLIKLKEYTTDLATYNVVTYNPTDATTRDNTRAAVTTFCLGCHKSAFNALTPYGDGRTPVSKSWDEQAIADKWVDGTTRFSPYDSATYNVTPAYYVLKANSPHKRPDQNQRDIAGNAAVGSNWSDTGGTASGADPTGVHCLDCHNAHGSNRTVERTWRIVRGGNSLEGGAGIPAADRTGGMLVSATGRWNGWNYTPSAGGGAPSYSAEADLCFDCHLGDASVTESDAKKFSDFGVGEEISDYYSGITGRWQTGDTWDTRSFTYKQPDGSNPPTMQSDHWSGTSNNTYNIMNTASEGQCTPCHDPHGVTPRTTANNSAAGNFLTTANSSRKLPILKGNWLTSPYKEDRAGDITTGASAMRYDPVGNGRDPGPTPRHHPNLGYNNPPIVGGGYGDGMAGSGTYGTGGSGHDGYFIDDNTWGTTSGEYWTSSGTPGSQSGRPRPNYPTTGPLSGTYENFGGLCSVCHAATNIKPGSTGARHSLTSVHNTVKDVQGNTFVANVFCSGTNECMDPNDNGRIWENNTVVMHAGLRQRSVGTGQAPHGLKGGNAYGSVSNNMAFPGNGYNNTVTAKGGTNNNHGGFGWGFDHNTNDMLDEGQFYTTGGLYHRYSCSKCHAPHAQALPRLMRTNCLETSNNNEPNRYQAKRDSSGSAVTSWTNDTHTNACHGEDYAPAWNDVTPWNNHDNSTGYTSSQGGWMRRGTGDTWNSPAGRDNGETIDEPTGGCDDDLTTAPTETCY